MHNKLCGDSKLILKYSKMPISTILILWMIELLADFTLIVYESMLINYYLNPSSVSLNYIEGMNIILIFALAFMIINLIVNLKTFLETESITSAFSCMFMLTMILLLTFQVTFLINGVNNFNFSLPIAILCLFVVYIVVISLMMYNAKNNSMKNDSLKIISNNHTKSVREDIQFMNGFDNLMRQRSASVQ